ncbi:hypothetical protein ACCO45_003131 [Purpureocillium lilacinum]
MARSSPRKKPTVNYNEDDAPKPLAKVVAKAKNLVAKTTHKRKAAAEADHADDDYDEVNGNGKDTPAPAAKKRKTAKAKKEEQGGMPLTERTAVASLKKAMYIGAHVSAAGGVQNSIPNAVHIGANAFALFLKSQRKWDNPPITTEARDLFLHNCKEHGYDVGSHALPHGSYLVNLAQADAAKANQAYASFVDDLRRCEQLGVRLYNFHPGSTLGDARPAAIARIAAQLNKAHRETRNVVTVLENMAGGGNVIGAAWEDLRDIIALVDDKDRVGVCIDTCHAFAAGHDLRTPEAFSETVGAFNDIVGAKYLKAFHLNDSKAPFNSNRDLHANIGTGFLGLRAFHSIMNHDAFRGLPMVLETPIDRKGPDGKSVEDKQVWADEIKLLESLIGMDPEGDEFTATAKRLQAEGAGERNKIQDQVDKKVAKDAKKAAGTMRGKGKGTVKGKRKTKAEASDDESD